MDTHPVDSTLLQVLHSLEQLLQRPAEPVEARDAKPVSSPLMVNQLGQPGRSNFLPDMMSVKIQTAPTFSRWSSLGG